MFPSDNSELMRNPYAGQQQMQGGYSEDPVRLFVSVILCSVFLIRNQSEYDADVVI